MELTGYHAFVVGGSSGIGAASVRLLAEKGATVAIGYLRGEDRATALCASLVGEGHIVVPIAVNDTGSIERARDIIQAAFGRLDILVNSAGVTRPVAHADLDSLDDELLDMILIGNVRGPFATIRTLAPMLKASGRGVVVNISSISGFTGSGSNIGYCASKAALDTMTLSLARALGPDIRVMCVSPGAVATGFLPGRDRAKLAEIALKTPLERVVEPEDVARAVYACAAVLTASTGGRIVVDGGRFLV